MISRLKRNLEDHGKFAGGLRFGRTYALTGAIEISLQRRLSFAVHNFSDGNSEAIQIHDHFCEY